MADSVQDIMDDERSLEDATAAVLTASRVLVGVSARSLTAIDEDVTLPQYRAMVILAAGGRHRVGSLAAELRIHPSSATRMCDRLERKGWIVREPAIDSRREVLIRLSDTGVHVLEMVTRLRTTEIRSILRNVACGDRERIIAALACFANAAHEAPDDAWMLGWS